MIYAFAYSENKANSTVLVLKCCYHSTMQLNGVFHDGETETCASEFAASAFIDTVESFKDTRQMFCWDSNAIVGECELPTGVCIGMRKGYCGPIACIGNGVVSEVAEDAMDKLIELSEENEEDITESLEEFAEALKAGEDPEISEDEYDTDSLPDGYMEAMEMFMMAEDISGESPKRGEVLSSEGTFEIVIAKAESGDPEAKFTAGKYFIADHIEDETERAIRWIREAAEAGIEEAHDYINTHSELFE